MDKKYKAGQIITIDNKRYRLKHSKSFGCFLCKYKEESTDTNPCNWCWNNATGDLYLTPLVK